MINCFCLLFFGAHLRAGQPRGPNIFEDHFLNIPSIFYFRCFALKVIEVGQKPLYWPLEPLLTVALDPLRALLEQNTWSKKSILDLDRPISEKKLKFFEIFLSVFVYGLRKISVVQPPAPKAVDAAFLEIELYNLGRISQFIYWLQPWTHVTFWLEVVFMPQITIKSVFWSPPARRST